MRVLRGRALRARWGKPQSFDTAEALRIAGLAGLVDEGDVVAYRYPSEKAFRAFAASNLARHGHPSIGPFPVLGGVVGIVDLRPALEKATQHRGGR